MNLKIVKNLLRNNSIGCNPYLEAVNFAPKGSFAKNTLRWRLTEKGLPIFFDFSELATRFFYWGVQSASKTPSLCFYSKHCSLERTCSGLFTSFLHYSRLCIWKRFKGFEGFKRWWRWKRWWQRRQR